MELLGVNSAILEKEPDVERGLTSWVYKSGEKCLIVKRCNNPRGRANMIRESMSSSHELDEQYRLESYVAIMQGEVNGEKVPIVAKVVPWLDDVTCISEMKPVEVLKDRELVESLCDIYRFGFEEAVKGRHFDLLRPSNKNANTLLKSLMSVFAKNIMVGNDTRNGKRKIFVDNDSHLDVKDNTFKRIAYSSLYLRNLIFYEILKRTNKGDKRVKREAENLIAI